MFNFLQPSFLAYFLGWLFGFYDTNYDFDNKDTRVAGFNLKICEVLIIIPVLE